MTQGELEKLPLPVARAFCELERQIMNDVIRRIRINGFSPASADWQLSRLQQLGALEEEIRDQIGMTLGIADSQVKDIFSDTAYSQYMGHSRAFQLLGMKQVPFEENRRLQQLISSISAQTTGTFDRITGSMGFVRQSAIGSSAVPLTKYYTDTLDRAMYQIHSGAFDYQTVLARTINEMTRSGLRWIDYSSGVHNRVEVAARRAVMTGFRQIQGLINEHTAKELGTDSYEVTWHAGARPTHQPWQGKVWTMKQLQSICGLGEVTGLYGANCYHDYNPFIPGVSVRTYTDDWLDAQNRKENTPKTYLGKQYTTYEALQRQRRMETVMRKYRRDIELMKTGGASDYDIVLKQARYRGKMQEYQAFSKSMGLPVQVERVYQDGLGKKAAVLKNYSNSSSMESDTRSLFVQAGSKYLNRFDELYKNAAKIKPIDGFEDIVCHGDPFSLIFKNSGGKEVNISAKEFAEMLRNDPNYKGGNIRLIACQVGAGYGIVPQFLAKEFGVKVLAPSEIVNIDFDGNIILADNEENARMGIETGKWITFKP